jgi:hypothetical protein
VRSPSCGLVETTRKPIFFLRVPLKKPRTECASRSSAMIDFWPFLQRRQKRRAKRSLRTLWNTAAKQRVYLRAESTNESDKDSRQRGIPGDLRTVLRAHKVYVHRSINDTDL